VKKGLSGKNEMTTLLPGDALKGVRIGISVSDSPDLARLGLVETHFRLALGEIARAALLTSGALAYGGYLDPDGYTAFLAQELRRYGRRNRPLLVCLPWQEHRRVALSELEQRGRELGLFGKIVCLDPDGVEVDPTEGRGEAPVTVDDSALRRRALTAMRRYMLNHTNGRVFLGGRRHGFQGEIPGLMEEALFAVEARQPIYLAGGYGGVTLDIARALGVDDGSWLPAVTGAGAPPDDDPRFADGYARLAALARAPGWPGLRNGLSDEENHRLAATHRPSEIAALVTLGLGRLAQEPDPPA
jgi:hypothetical protein